MSSHGAWIDYLSISGRLPLGGKTYTKGNTVIWEWESVLARFLGHGIVKWSVEDLAHDMAFRRSP